MRPLFQPPEWSLPTLESSSGCFETMRAYGGRIFRLPAHLDRLYASAKYMGLTIPEAPEPFGRRLTQALRKARWQEAVVRVALIPEKTMESSRFEVRRSKLKRPSLHSAFRAASPSIAVVPAQAPPPELYRRGLQVAVVPTRKFPVSQIDPQAKFSARLGSVMALLDGQLRRADEILFLDGPGYVTESTASNFGIILRGELLAAPCWMGRLAGITWQGLIEVASALKIPVRETPLTRHDVYNADEAFMSSTLKEIIAVTQIDGRRIGNGKPGPVVARLHRAFQALVRRELRLK